MNLNLFIFGKFKKKERINSLSHIITYIKIVIIQIENRIK